MSVDGVSYFEHELVRDGVLEAREYQVELAEGAKAQNSLIVLPTGTGKTPVAAMIAADRLSTYPTSRMLMLAPTKPLVEQQAEFFKNVLRVTSDEVVVFTGEIRPDDRKKVWDDPSIKIVVATPQVVKNDLIDGSISLQDVSYLVVDECHRASGDYPYSFIANTYVQQGTNVLISGLSASPGANRSDILKVCQSLNLYDVHIKTADDPSMKKYIPDTEVEYQLIDLPEELVEMQSLLQDAFQDRLKKLKEIGVIDTTAKNTPFYKLQDARKQAQTLISQNDSDGYTAMSIHAQALKLSHAVGKVETEGVNSLKAYLERLERKASSSSASKADKQVMADSRVQQVMGLLEEHSGVLHPKKRELRIAILEAVALNGGQAIVFSGSRDVVDDLVDFLNETVSAHRFVGQGSKDGDKGMTQKEQQEVLDDFRNQEYDVLVATSVAEEGLDIPTVDLVVIYEPVASAVRDIQRRGRTGRHMPGNVRVLVAKGTQDEGKYWAAKRSKKSMKTDLDKLKEEDIEAVISELQDDKEQSSLTAFNSSEQSPTVSTADGGESIPDVDVEDVEQDDTDVTLPTVQIEAGILRVIVDRRELNSTVPSALKGMSDVEVQLETLDVGDYVVSDRVIVERKTMQDFLETLVSGDRDVWNQLGDVARNCERPTLLLEGDLDDLFSTNVHPNSIYGILVTLWLSFGIAVIHSRNENETATLLARMAKREQEKSGSSEVNHHAKKSERSPSEQMVYTVSSIADVGPKTAKALLSKFGTVRAVFTASDEELMDVEGVGKKTAESIVSLATGEYSTDE